MRVCKELSLDKGPITVISHSISIDPSRYDFAQDVVKKRKHRMRRDPHGEFQVGIEDDMIVIRHLSGGIVLNEYYGADAERIQHALARDCAISDINHAIYVGRQLSRAEHCLKSGEEFIQE